MEPHGPGDADDNGPLDGSWNGHHGKIPIPWNNVALNANSVPGSLYEIMLILRIVCKDYGHVIPYLEGERIHAFDSVSCADYDRTNIQGNQTSVAD